VVGERGNELDKSLVVAIISSRDHSYCAGSSGPPYLIRGGVNERKPGSWISASCKVPGHDIRRRDELRNPARTAMREPRSRWASAGYDAFDPEPRLDSPDRHAARVKFLASDRTAASPARVEMRHGPASAAASF